MRMASNLRVLWTIPLVITISLFSFPAYAKYSGGIGTASNPYKIATAADLILLGESPQDYSKHFILTVDIDLNANLPGRKTFDKAVIAPDTDPVNGGFQGTSFTGVFYGNGHKISHLTIEGKSYVGLFGQLSSGAEVKNLGIVDVNVTGSNYTCGGLVGRNDGGIVTACYSIGMVSGNSAVGVLVGSNCGSIATSYSSGTVSGNGSVGGLVGFNDGSIAMSYSTGMVSGARYVGGLVGDNYKKGDITTSYSTGAVSGRDAVGGLVSRNYGSIAASYSIGMVGGDSGVGGLVGYNYDGSITTSFWDMESSGQATSAGGTGLTTTELQDINTYLNAGWDFVDEVLNGTCDYWQISTGDYPRLRYHIGNSPVMPEGLGTDQEPYLIRDARDLGTVWFKPLAHYRLEASVDLSGIKWSMAVTPWFGGTFDGNGYVISNLHIQGSGYLGLFGHLCTGAMISNLGLEAVDVNGTGNYTGGLVGRNDGIIAISYSTGTVTGNEDVGGLVGSNEGSITTSYSTGTVSGDWSVGGLVGSNGGDVTQFYNAGTVSGGWNVGGLVGYNVDGTTTRYYAICTVQADESGGGLVDLSVGSRYEVAVVADCYSIVFGGSQVSGLLVGRNGARAYGKARSGLITNCYASCDGSGMVQASGLVGHNAAGEVVNCFWDAQACVLADSTEGGTPKTTAEMQTASTFFEWGICRGNIWTIDEGNDYPRLCWENRPGKPINPKLSDFLQGEGTQDRPYLVYTAEELNAIGIFPCEWGKHFKLMVDIDLSGCAGDEFNIIGTASSSSFTGVFDGNGHRISHLTITGGENMGLFGFLGSGAEVKNLGIVDVNVIGSGDYVGGLVGNNYRGAVTHCYSTGTVSGDDSVGGLVGYNRGSITTSYSTGTVSGDRSVGGLVGSDQYGDVTHCYSTGTVSGARHVGGLVGINYGNIATSYSSGTLSGNGSVGGLVGFNDGSIAMSYSTGAVSGDDNVGGLVGRNGGSITASFWDKETSGLASSDGGTGKTTAEMQTAGTFLEAGWDFVDETANGTEDVWWILEGQDYPRLWWELIPEN